MSVPPKVLAKEKNVAFSCLEFFCAKDVKHRHKKFPPPRVTGEAKQPHPSSGRGALLHPHFRRKSRRT